MPTIADTWRAAQARLAVAREVGSREGKQLVQHVLGIDETQIILLDNNDFPVEKEPALEDLVSRRVAGEPLGYILGFAWFYGRTWAVGPGVLIPRPDTEILVEECLRRMPDIRHNYNMLELGVGSGCIGGTLLAERPEARYTGVEISESAWAIATENIAKNLEDMSENEAASPPFAQEAPRPSPRRWNVVLQDGLDGIAGKFDLLVSNPPYVTDEEWAALEGEVKDFEPRLALTGGEKNPDGLLFYRKLAAWGGELVRNGGWLCVEVGWRQAEAVRELLQEHKNRDGTATWHEISVCKDLGGRDRVVCAQRV